MTGTITISLDFELGWGVIGNGDWERREALGIYRELRPTLRHFINLLDSLDIPCIWAIVGAMIDTPQTRDLSHLKGDYGDKARRFLKESEPGTHDGRDLLDLVLGASSHQAFGTHGYSHVLFNDPHQNASVYQVELQKARETNTAAGLNSQFMVFPENRMGYLDILAETGIQVARTPPANAPDPDLQPRLLKRALGSFTRPVSPVSERTLNNGLRLHSGSELLNWGARSGATKKMATQMRVARANHAAKCGAHIHYWLHPFNLVETSGLMPFIERTLKDMARARDAGKIVIRTME